MNAKPEIYLGAPIEIESERVFLAQLCADLEKSGISGLIFANFHLPPRNPIHQIDFLVILDWIVCQIELKSFSVPVVGTANGVWQLKLPDGAVKPYQAKNPFDQALGCKFALSDQMAEFAETNHAIPKKSPGKKYYTQIEAAICVFPELLPGSRITNNVKVRGLGYPSLFEFVKNTSRSPGWSRDNWIDFAMHLGLLRQDHESILGTDRTAAAMALVDDYVRRYCDFYGQELPSLVPTNIEINDDVQSSLSLSSHLQSRGHLHLVGRSGSGKSHNAVHLAIAACQSHCIPIFVRAADYTGRLSTLLDRSVAHLCPCTSAQFFAAAKTCGCHILLVVDGLNECPDNYEKALFKDLQALYLRMPFSILTTAQSNSPFPECLRGTIARFCDLIDQERLALLSTYFSGPLPERANELCQSFGSAYEITVFATCIAELTPPLTRARLFDTFCRRLCDKTVDYALARRALSRIADSMREQFCASLPIDQVWRISEAVLDENRAPVTILSVMLSCGIVDVRQGICAFRHEMLQRYFEAFAVNQRAATASQLMEELLRPRNRDLVEFVLALQDEASRMRACLIAASERGATSNLITDSLLGRYGELPRCVVISDANTMLNRAASDVEVFDIQTEVDQGSWQTFSISTTSVPSPTSYEEELVRGITQSLAHGMFVEEAFTLVRHSERRCFEILRVRFGNEVNKISFRSEVFSQLAIRGTANGGLVGSKILQFADNWDMPHVTAKGRECLSTLLENLRERSVSELYLLVCLFKSPEVPPENKIPAILETCWNTGVYHLRLLMLERLCSWRMVGWPSGTGLADSTIENIRACLSRISTQNLFLNTQLVEALMAYEVLEPFIDADQVKSELAAILQTPDDEDSRKMAYGAISNIFEEVYSDAYWRAIEELPIGDRVQLFIMGGLASPMYSFSNDYILEELLRLNDKRALPVFQRFATYLDAQSGFSQTETYSYILAQIGCAKYYAVPASLPDGERPSRYAYQCLGQIIFWLNKHDLLPNERRFRCEPLWGTLESKLALDAIGPIIRFASTVVIKPNASPTPVEVMFSTFKEEIRRILEHGMRHREAISIFDERQQPVFALKEHTVFLITTLGQIGNLQTIPLLMPFVEDSVYGAAAVDAIRSLKSERLFERLRYTPRL